MRCHVCGADMEKIITDLPFKVREDAIIVLKGLPVWQCTSCTEFLIEDDIMAAVDRKLASMDDASELEVVRFAA